MPPQETTPSSQAAEDADRRVVRRAFRAGALLFAGLCVSLVPFGLASGGGGGAVLIWVTSALVAGLLVSSGWLVLALLLDLIAGTAPGRRRMVITAITFGLAFVAPVLPFAALQAAGTA